MEDDIDVLIEDDIVKAIILMGVFLLPLLFLLMRWIYLEIAFKKSISKSELEQKKHMNYVGVNIWWR